MLEMGEGGIAHHAALAAAYRRQHVDLVFACGPQMKALWDALPAKRRGAYAETSAALAPKVLAALKPGDTVLVKGSNGARMSVIIEALKAKGGLMLYYLSLLTHTDQLAFFRLFRYLTFRSGAAVVTALLIAFLINPMLIRWLKVQAGQGPAHPQRRSAAPYPGKGGHAHHGWLADPDPLGGFDHLWASLSNRYVWIALMVTISLRHAGLPGRLL